MPTKIVSATLDAAAEATDWIGAASLNPRNTLDLGIEADGSWAGTIQLQKTHDKGVTVHVVKEYTADAQEYVEDNIQDVWYRLYCSARSAGSALCELYK